MADVQSIFGGDAYLTEDQVKAQCLALLDECRDMVERGQIHGIVLVGNGGDSWVSMASEGTENVHALGALEMAKADIINRINAAE
jgi:hypothetical protein